MKTANINLLKKGVLVVELPEGTANFSVINTGDRIAISAFDEYDNCLDVKGIPTNYTLLGKPDELKEHDVRELVHLLGDKSYTWVNYEKQFYGFKTSLESFNSALETVIFWDVNPLGDEPNHLDYKFEKYKGEFHFKSELHKSRYGNAYEKWQEAELSTFDRNRILIFIEN